MPPIHTIFLRSSLIEQWDESASETAPDVSEYAGELPNRLKYDYGSTYFIDKATNGEIKKKSDNSFGPDRSSQYGNVEATRNQLNNDIMVDPEILASNAYLAFPKSVKAQLGISNLNMGQIDEALDDENGGELQAKMQAVMHDAIYNENTTWEYKLANGEQKTIYTYCEDVNGDGVITPDEKHLEWDTKDRHDAKQVTATYAFPAADGGIEYTTVTYNMDCGNQEAVDVVPEGIRQASSESSSHHNRRESESESESESRDSKDTSSTNNSSNNTTTTTTTTSISTGTTNTGRSSSAKTETRQRQTEPQQSQTEPQQPQPQQPQSEQPQPEQPQPKNQQEANENSGASAGIVTPEAQEQPVTSEPISDHSYNQDTNTYDAAPSEQAADIGYEVTQEPAPAPAPVEQPAPAESVPAEPAPEMVPGTSEGTSPANDFDAGATVATGEVTAEAPSADNSGNTIQENLDNATGNPEVNPEGNYEEAF